tara:strand:- start:239 stop:1072 length:834 start_codon:yes stop_codon:yes gene_type:complete
MADYGLSGHATEASIAIPGTGSLGRVFATSTDGDDQDEWNDLRSGGFSETLTANQLIVLSSRNSSTPRISINRCFLTFPIPNNLSRLDSTPQLQLYASSVSGTGIVIPVSVSYTNFAYPWNTISANNAFTSVQTGAGAAYTTSRVTITAGANTLTLNEVAKAHVLMGGALERGTRYVTIAIMDYAYDHQGVLPADGVFNSITFDDLSDSNHPSLVLRKPWFVNDRGDEFPVDDDYTIRAFDVGVNQKDRSVPQLPFSTTIKGPRSLRGKNVPYKVTT